MPDEDGFISFIDHNVPKDMPSFVCSFSNNLPVPSTSLDCSLLSLSLPCSHHSHPSYIDSSVEVAGRGWISNGQTIEYVLCSHHLPESEVVISSLNAPLAPCPYPALLSKRENSHHSLSHCAIINKVITNRFRASS